MNIVFRFIDNNHAELAKEICRYEAPLEFMLRVSGQGQTLHVIATRHNREPDGWWLRVYPYGFGGLEADSHVSSEAELADAIHQFANAR